MKRLLILKLGSTFPDLARTHGDFEDWIARGLSLPAERIAVADAQSLQQLPAPQEFCGVVLTGSHSMVTDAEPWSERVSDWVAGAVEAEVPLVGICYGHQLLARALGGEVDYNPRGEEYGTVEVLLGEASSGD
ncbi:MAG: gamma-glutamyl-gamma-aminobutyrate hydrolase family protein, partial [Thermoguttaceae bacterium]|nr:gamma-glutamyl-gamma-aminobutyrate hydrolase family protein [Thermoguttaceae bacterium]